MAVIQPKTLAGMMELLPARQMQMERMMIHFQGTHISFEQHPVEQQQAWNYNNGLFFAAHSQYTTDHTR